MPVPCHVGNSEAQPRGSHIWSTVGKNRDSGASSVTELQRSVAGSPSQEQGGAHMLAAAAASSSSPNLGQPRTGPVVANTAGHGLPGCRLRTSACSPGSHVVWRALTCCVSGTEVLAARFKDPTAFMKGLLRFEWERCSEPESIRLNESHSG